MVEQARQRTPPELAERVRFEQADAAQLPFEDGAFDLVQLANMIPFFDELARVTAPGGHARPLVLGRPGDADLGAARAPSQRARRARFHGFCGLRGRRRARRSLPAGRSPLGLAPQGRSRRGHTGPDVLPLRDGAARLGGRGEVAQLVEHTAENRGVAGSIPALAIRLLVARPSPAGRAEPLEQLALEQHLVGAGLAHGAVEGGRLVAGERDQADVRMVAPQPCRGGDAVEQAACAGRARQRRDRGRPRARSPRARPPRCRPRPARAARRSAPGASAGTRGRRRRSGRGCAARPRRVLHRWQR